MGFGIGKREMWLIGAAFVSPLAMPALGNGQQATNLGGDKPAAVSLAAGSPASASADQEAKPSFDRKKAFADYEVKARELLKVIRDNSSAAQVKSVAQDLTAQGNAIGRGWIKSFPQCKDYIEACIEVTSRLASISSDQLEEGYHKDKALGKAPKNCYHAKDLIIHPASVWVIANEKQLEVSKAPVKEQMSNEIQEVLGHLTIIRSALVKNAG